MPKAVRFDRSGDVSVLAVADVDFPHIGADDLLVRVHTAGINVGDAEIRSSELHERWPATFPSGRGSDFAGVAEAAGAAVADVQRGDEVAGFTNSRASHAELAALPEDQLAMKPAQVSRETAGRPDTATQSCGSRPQPATGSSGDLLWYRAKAVGVAVELAVGDRGRVAAR